jgi:hypothetical protein
MDNLSRNVKQLGEITSKISEKYGKAKDILKIDNVIMIKFSSKWIY